MILMICNSNMFVPIIMTEVLMHVKKRYIVASDNAGIIRFFTEMDIPNVVIIQYQQPARWDIFKSRKRFVEDFFSYNIVEVYFFNITYGGIINWLILKLSRTAKVYHCKADEILYFPNAEILFDFEYRIKQWLHYRVAMDKYNPGTGKQPALPVSFYRKVKAIFITKPINHKIIEEYIENKLNKNGLHKGYMLLTGSTVNFFPISSEDYAKDISAIIDSIGTDKLVSKLHPMNTERDLYGREKDLKQIPDYIPGNILIDFYDVFIGYESTLLIEAAVTGKMVISLVYLIHMNNSNISEIVYEVTMARLANRGTIFFPKTLEELKSIINNQEQ